MFHELPDVADTLRKKPPGKGRQRLPVISTAGNNVDAMDSTECRALLRGSRTAADKATPGRWGGGDTPCCQRDSSKDGVKRL